MPFLEIVACVTFAVIVFLSLAYFLATVMDEDIGTMVAALLGFAATVLLVSTILWLAINAPQQAKTCPCPAEAAEPAYRSSTS